MAIGERITRRTTDEWEGRIGEQVRSLRERAGLTQGDLAKRSNVSIGAVQNLEYGAGSRLATLVQVTRALGRGSWLEDLAPPVSTSPMKLLEARQASTLPALSPEVSRSLQRSMQAIAASVPSIDPELGRAFAESLSEALPALSPEVSRSLQRSMQAIAASVPSIDPELGRAFAESLSEALPALSPEVSRSLQRSMQAIAASVPSIDPELGRAIAQSLPTEAIESSQRRINTAGWGGADSGAVREGEEDDLPGG